MTQLVDDILFLSELEQGREVVALGFTEIAPYVHELYGESRERALRAELALEADVPEGLSCRCGPACCCVVLGNLLDNSLRYAGRGATFRITAAPGGETSCSRCPTTAPASIPPTCRACSSASSARPLAHHARHGPRARDRQAHHQRGRRHRRGRRQPRRGHPLPLRPARAAHGGTPDLRRRAADSMRKCRATSSTSSSSAWRRRSRSRGSSSAGAALVGQRALPARRRPGRRGDRVRRRGRRPLPRPAAGHRGPARAADAGRRRPAARAGDAARQSPSRAHGRLLRDDRQADEALAEPDLGRLARRGLRGRRRARRGDDPRGARVVRRRATSRAPRCWSTSTS